MSKQVWNFSAGPSVLPKEVLLQAQEEMLDWQGSGQSVMEMSHRSAEFTQICDEAEKDLRKLLRAGDEFAVLFMQGGATAQNAIIPLNLIGLKKHQKAEYVVSGSWSQKSYKEALKYGDIHVVAHNNESLEIEGKTYGPLTWMSDPFTWEIDSQASYLHYCSNETISGLELIDLPSMNQLGFPDVALVQDASSHFLSRPINLDTVDLLYAGAQKNAGPAGVTHVVVRRELLGRAQAICPSAFDYAQIDEAKSRLNTPPTYAIYIAGLVFKWLLKQGGLEAIEQKNIEKANLLYEVVDRSGFYHNPIHPDFRSRMNIPFILSDDSLNELFLDGAKQRGLINLKGHKSVGGMRASIYNAMPLEGVQALVEYLNDFEKKYG